MTDQDSNTIESLPNESTAIPPTEETVEYWLQKTVDLIIEQRLIGVKLPAAKTIEEARNFYNELVATLDNVRRACESAYNFDGREIR